MPVLTTPYVSHTLSSPLLDSVLKKVPVLNPKKGKNMMGRGIKERKLYLSLDILDMLRAK